MEKEKLANNNLSTQLELYEDISRNYSNILHHVQEKGYEIHNIIKKLMQSNEKRTNKT